MRIGNSILYALLLGALFFVSCSNGDKLTVKGDFISSNKDTVYFEHRSLGGIEVLDSAILTSNGTFKFKSSIPSNPEFYQLRVNNQTVVFAVDDQSEVVINGDLNDLVNTFTVSESSENKLMQEVDKKTNQVKRFISSLERQHESNEIDDMEYLNLIDSTLTDYKTEVSNIILGNPAGAAAYYAVFQKINDYLIFDPYDKKDYAMYGAVATSWNKYYPDAPRTKHLYEFTMNALKLRKQQEKQAEFIENASVVNDSSLPDISLRGIDGKKASLESLRGKVVVLDFTVYNSEFSPKHNINLNNIYKSFANQGVEIYQISFDSDEHLWKNAASNLPWITVRDPQSVYSRLLSTYNVRELPTAFILNKEGDVVARVENYNTLTEEIRKVI